MQSNLAPKFRRCCVFLALAATLLTALPALACGPRVEVRFAEASDGDIFEIKNTSEEPWSVDTVVITLTGSAGRLVFDTEHGGLGASMPAPLQTLDGGDDDVRFLGATPVDDGSEIIALKFARFGPGRSFVFLVDVDDRLEASPYGQATVTGAEIAGAGGEAEVSMAGSREAKARGEFRNNGQAVLTAGGLCA